MINPICTAIHNNNLIDFYYDGGMRSVEPHAYGVSRQGNELLRGYQVSGYTSSGKVPGWKLFRVDEISNLTIRENSAFQPGLSISVVIAL